MKTIKYGLRIKNTDDLLQIKVIEIKGNQENDTVYLLEAVGDGPWLLENADEVKEALNRQTNWYDSTLNCPYIAVSKNQLEVVEVSEIKRINVYSPNSIYEDLDSYHRQKVEEALKRHEVEKEKKTKYTIKDENTEKPVEEMMEFFSPAVAENLTPVQEKRTIKAKVKCIKDIPKEIGSVRMKSDPISFCFKEGRHYLAYIKQEKLFIMNEDKVPEFVCNAPTTEVWGKNIFFERHFAVEEYID